MNVPERDRFQVISEHAPNRFLYDKSYLGVERTEDVTVSIVESTREDWSFGNGIAQYVVLPREEWK